MKLITRWTLAASAAQRWETQYGRNRRSESYKVLKALVDLGPRPNPDDVDRIIGNKSWTKVGTCHECNRVVETLVDIGEEPDIKSNTVYLCAPCLLKALGLIEEG